METTKNLPFSQVKVDQKKTFTTLAELTMREAWYIFSFRLRDRVRKKKNIWVPLRFSLESSKPCLLRVWEETHKKASFCF